MKSDEGPSRGTKEWDLALAEQKIKIKGQPWQGSTLKNKRGATMNLKQALEIVKPEGNTIDDLKKAYRALCKQYHPDVNPDGEELMKTINNAYEFLKNNLGKWSYQTEYGPSILDSLQEMFNNIRHCQGLKVEVCGNWLWVSGNTKIYKDLLKSLKMRWSKNKSAWYWHPEDYRKMSKKVFDLDEIRQMFGSTELETERSQAIN